MSQPKTAPASPDWLTDFEIAPPTATSFDNQRFAFVRNRGVLNLYAPAQLEWALTGTERDFRFEYGFLPRAYEEGKSNGADVLVELSYSGQSHLLFQRHLDPANNPKDREDKISRVILPPFPPGSRLILRTAPGEYNDNAWDWIYVCNIRFKHDAHFIAEQFPSFERLPSVAEAEYSYLYQKDGATSFLQLNAPARLEFPLQGNEHHLGFRFGFLAGAYLNGGQTDGASFIVELLAPDYPTQVLFQRRLLPAGQESDRGPQTVELTLPILRPRANLVVRIDPGSSNSWDWTYISNLQLK